MDLLSLLDKEEESSSFVTYETAVFEVQMYEIDLEKGMEDLFYNLESNCATIPIWKTVCDDDTSSCQLADINIKTSENAIVILSQSLFSLSRICELPDYPSSAESIERCHNGRSWTTSEGVNEQYTFLTDMLQGYYRALVREKRFVVSGPIAITTAIGILSATSAVSASYAVA